MGQSQRYAGRKIIFIRIMNHFTNNLFITFQHLVPQHLLSRSAGYFAECETECVKNFFINRFIQHYNVNMAEAAEPDYTKYKNFNQFFTRALKNNARTIADGDCVISPADGAISQLGAIESGRIFQAKGQDYSALELLTGNEKLAQHFHDGFFATIYLSPKDYHRVHAPISGALSDMIYVPGKLFSVNGTTANHVPCLFARNERLICIFETEIGKVAVILVGAMIVAGIETVWAGQIAPPLKTPVNLHNCNTQTVILAKGDELGRFKLGSTVILLFEKNRVCAESHFKAGSLLRMGEKIATVTR
jgi:phosphatidylserine decarboxylase